MTRIAASLLFALAAAGPAFALEPVPAGLPALDAANPPKGNPYRGSDAVLEAGGVAYERYCAECHGERSSRPVAEGPDLRRLNTFCNRLTDTALKTHCLADVDTYFLFSVREGKLRAGQMHMPAWKTVLPPETIWAIRSYTETRPLPPPRTLPDLPKR
ncbi:c-type cytochrome [Piscinibacter sp.]|uniref:c-type cytochrome n=1 Tax=Piscinibacter sp. TaxID=1903157 RepID=UPI0039E2F1B4